MLRYLLKRILMLLPILLIVSIVAFALVRLVPVDPVESYMSSLHIPMTPENTAYISEMLGLDKPILVQYFIWLSDAMRLNFGNSYLDSTPVIDLLKYSLKYTIELAAGALVWIVVLTFTIALLSVRKPEGAFDNFGRVITMLGVAVPNFVLGFILVRCFSLNIRIFPVSGHGTPLHLVLPSFTLAVAYIATYSRMLRNNMLSNMESRPVSYARIRGLDEKYIQNKHVLRNALLPIVGSFGVSFGRLIAGSVIVENVFAWPGLGRLITLSVLGRDYPVIQGYILFMAVIFIAANLISDILCAAIDPRIRKDVF